MDGPQTRALADLLNRRMTGSPLDRIDVPENRWQANVLLMNCTGQVIQRIHARGKWLIFDFSHGISWLFQLVAQSRWVFSPTPCDITEGTKTTKRAPLLKVTYRNGTLALLIGRPLFLILPTEQIAHHPEIHTLGPDPALNPPDAFEESFAYRLRDASARTIAAALLDQDIVAGLGNALKCEVLFAANIAPSTRVGTLMASDISRLATRLAETYHSILAATLAGKPILYRVYDLLGEPCLKCGHDILADRSGSDGHLSWYCPHCQPKLEQASLF